MNKFTFRFTISVALTSVLALSLAGCKKPVVMDNTILHDDQVMEGASSDAFVGSIGDLMKNDKDVTCTFMRSDTAGDMDGTVYVTRDGRMRGTFNLSSPQFGTMAMEVIRDREYGYTWGFPSATQGTKVKLDENGKPIKDNNKESGIDDSMEYRCTKWKVNEAMLRVPNDVTFQDISTQVEQINNAMQGVKNAKCGACDSLPEGTGRDQCKVAMGC